MLDGSDLQSFPSMFVEYSSHTDEFCDQGPPAGSDIDWDVPLICPPTPSMPHPPAAHDIGALYTTGILQSNVNCLHLSDRLHNSPVPGRASCRP